jgi:hypothetical protein
MRVLAISMKTGKLSFVHLTYSRKYCEIIMLTHLITRMTTHELSTTHRFTFLMIGKRQV